MIRAAAVFAALVGVFAGPAGAQEPVEIDPEVGASAVSMAPSISKTLSDFTVASTLDPAEAPLSLELSNFLLDHPDLSAFIVKRRNLAPYSISMQGPRESLADDGDGTRGTITLVRRESGRRVYYGEGTHVSRLFPTIYATAVIYMDIRERSRPDCRPQVRTEFRVYVRLKNPIISRMVKALRPFLRGTITRKFSKALSVADRVGRLTAADPDAIQGDVAAFPLISPAERQAFRSMAEGLKAGPATCPGWPAPGPPAHRG